MRADEETYRRMKQIHEMGTRMQQDEPVLMSRLEELERWEHLHPQRRHQLMCYFEGPPWGERGAELSEPASRRAQSLWQHHPEVRPVLTPVVTQVPCAAFVRIVNRLVLQGERQVDWEGWLECEPTLAGQWRQELMQGAGQFNEPRHALRDAVLWARHLEGGAEAWLAFARSFKRAWRRGSAPDEDALHLYLDHAVMEPQEVEQVVAALAESGHGKVVDEMARALRRRRHPASSG